MKKSVFHFLLAHIFLLSAYQASLCQTVKIMPMGNSITYDNNSLDVPPNDRPIGDRISYRYKLFQLLSSAGYDFDFVGSEYSGGNYLGSEYDDNAGFPGITDDQLDHLINTGYNQRDGIQETPGPYLNYYPADIILLHIGTNGLTTDPSDVEDILDDIRFYDSDVYILVARIINRKTYHAATTIFNDNVEAMVEARNDNRIIMVDMENGAGINYSTEMVDDLHPSQAGYDKMALVWFDALNALNQSPEIITIPEQSTDEGTNFQDINLDNYVTDVEDPDYLLNWSYTQQPSSNLNVSIDGNRILQVSPVDPEWSGSEDLWLKVGDTGSGAFKKYDSVEVTFTVGSVNDIPVIDGQNPISMDENTSRDITLSDLTVTDNDHNPEELQIEILEGSNYSFEGQSLIPIADFYGTLYVDIQVCDPLDCSEIFTLTVNVINRNDPPVINSTPITSADDYEYYSYNIIVEDPNEEDTSIYFFDAQPDWLNFNIETTTLEGTPKWDDADNFFDVKIGVTDNQDTVYQEYTIYVSDTDDPPEFISTPDFLAFTDSVYSYEISYHDNDENDELTLSVMTTPEWLDYTQKDQTLSGTPPSEAANTIFPVVLALTDGMKTVFQSYDITVQRLTPLTSKRKGQEALKIFPNPTSEVTHIQFDVVYEERQVHLYNIQGKLVDSFIIEAGTNELIIDLSALENGLYFIQSTIHNTITTGIILKE
jgi:hypothetical protein